MAVVIPREQIEDFAHRFSAIFKQRSTSLDIQRLKDAADLVEEVARLEEARQRELVCSTCGLSGEAFLSEHYGCGEWRWITRCQYEHEHGEGR